MSTPESEICGNTGCGCPCDAGESYCSGYCANVAHHDDEPEEHACSCGHAPCVESQEVPRDQDAVTTSIGHGPGSRAAT